MLRPEIIQFLSEIEYTVSVRKPPDNNRRGQFRAGWEDATKRGRVYGAKTLAYLTWRNLGYRYGRKFGQRSPEEINEVYCILAEEYQRLEDTDGWRTEVKSWIYARWKVHTPLAEDIALFFEQAFDNTQYPERAWFGIHQNAISLVTGGIFLAAILKSGIDKGFWLLVDWPVPIDGVEYSPTQSTLGSKFPLNWAHSTSLNVILSLDANNPIWDSFASASEKIHYSPRIASERDEVQRRRNKRRLNEFWIKKSPNLLPDELENTVMLPEGAKRQIIVNAYERNDIARQKCIEYYGRNCYICGFSFGATYGEVAEDIIHVHHLRQLSEIGQEYIVDPIQDLRPVCPNCHAVIHSRRNPPLSIEEVKELLQQMGK